MNEFAEFQPFLQLKPHKILEALLKLIDNYQLKLLSIGF